MVLKLSSALKSNIYPHKLVVLMVLNMYEALLEVLCVSCIHLTYSATLVR